MAHLMWFLILALNLSICLGYKFLVVFPMPSRSHGILGDSMVKHLLAAGHEVTYITPYHYNRETHPKLNIVDVSATAKVFSSEDLLNVTLIMEKVLNFNAEAVTNLFTDVAIYTLENENIQKFIRKTEEQFDAVISEWLFSDLYSTFSAVFDCPLIWLSTLEPHWIILNLLDGPPNPAYTSDYLHDNVPPMSFTQRVFELWTQVDGLIRKNFIYYYKEEAAFNRLIVSVLKERGKQEIPSYEAIRYNASLTLGNSQAIIGDAFSLPQSYKHVGGYHIDDEIKALPQDLKKIMDASKYGVIYFSMGSNLKSRDLPAELKRGILNVFRRLKQTVIWKFEEVLPDTPNNVHILQWAPQQSILAHPNMVLFITHGGLLSITETIHFGVPIITIPVFADQFLNSVRAEKRGFSKTVKLSNSMDKDMGVAIEEVLSNPKYSVRVKELFTAYHDRPMKPKEELVYWISHVVRTRGAPHLRSPALELYLYQRLYIDLIGIVLVFIYIIKTTITFILSLSVNKYNNKEKQS